MRKCQADQSGVQWEDLATTKENHVDEPNSSLGTQCVYCFLCGKT